MLPREIPLKHRLAARCQWFLVSVPFCLGVTLTYFPMGALVAATSRRECNSRARRTDH